jgi:hypothetical protein
MRLHFALVLPALLVLYSPAQAAQRITMHQRFEQANTTHDGHLTLDQAKVGMKSVARHFDAIDKDHKGYVTEADIHAYYKDLRAARHHAADATTAAKG